MLGLGGIFKGLSAVAFYFAWKSYKLPNQDATGLALEECRVSESDGDVNTTEEGRKEGPGAHRNEQQSPGNAQISPAVEV